MATTSDTSSPFRFAISGSCQVLLVKSMAASSTNVPLISTTVRNTSLSVAENGSS